MSWAIQKLNIDGATAGMAANGNPFVSQYDSQLHVGYWAVDGTIRDIWTPAPLSAPWTQQQIDQYYTGPSDLTIQGDVTIGTYLNQQHFCYIRGHFAPQSGSPEPGTIADSFYDGSSGWHGQEIEQEGGAPGPAWSGQLLIPGPLELIGPFTVSVWTWAQQQHFTYVDYDNNVWDCWYDQPTHSWNNQRINNGGNTGAPPAIAKPFGCVFTPPTAPYEPPSNLAGQQHVAYRAPNGEIWDAWWDGQPGHSWAPQKLNIDGASLYGTTNAPAAAGNPFVWVLPDGYGWYGLSSYHIQQHFTYAAAQGALWDLWYDAPSNTWNMQELNIDGLVPYRTTNAPASAGNPAACVVGTMLHGRVALEQHVVYRDGQGGLWHLWYDGSPTWFAEQLNLGVVTAAPAAVGDPVVSYYTFVDDDGSVYGRRYIAWLAPGGEIWAAWLDLATLPGQPGGRG
jgi:hypothetical protein